MKETLIAQALHYASRGWPVFPCNRNKTPRTPNGFYDASTDEDKIKQWWGKWPAASIGIPTGVISGLVILDVDTVKGGDESLVELCRNYHPLPNTVQSITGSGGSHFFFIHSGGVIPNSSGKLGQGLDIRGDGGYIIAPPSPHPSGGAGYLWELSSDPDDTNLARLPEWLLALISDHPQPSPVVSAKITRVPIGPIVAGCEWLQHCHDDAATLPEPSWHGMLTIVGRCVDGDALAHTWSQSYPGYSAKHTDAKVQHALDDSGPVTCKHIRNAYDGESYCAKCQHWGKLASPISLGKVERSMVTQESRSPTPWGDVSNAEDFANVHGTNTRYCPRLGGWFLWDSGWWQQDDNEQIMELGRSSIRHTLKDAVAREDEKRIKHLAGRFTHSKLGAMLAQAATLPGIPVSPSVFDRDPWLLNCANGTIDLRMGVLRPHDREDFITRCLVTSYDPQAVCPTWDAFLHRIMGGPVGKDSPDDSALLLETRAEAGARAARLTAFLQRSIGYALTGVTHEDCLFILHGSGRNGKSRFIDAIHALLGAYATSAQMTTFLYQDRETVRNDLADLYGVRFVSAIETTEGRRFSEGLLKQLTGGDRLKARFLFKEYFEFIPQFKIFLAFNHKPEIQGTDVAMWERIKTVPFDVYIPPDERDKHLQGKLHAELPGILTWAIRGCLDWQKHGLDEPAEVTHATQAYRDEMDVVGQFFADRCLVCPEVRVKIAQLFAAFIKWCEEANIKPFSLIRFTREVQQRGIQRVVLGQNVKWYVGIALHAED